MLFSSTSFLCALAMLPARIGRRLLYCVLAAVNKIKHLEILKCFLILTVIYPHTSIFYYLCYVIAFPPQPFSKDSQLSWIFTCGMFSTWGSWNAVRLRTASDLQLLFLLFPLRTRMVSIKKMFKMFCFFHAEGCSQLFPCLYFCSFSLHS